MQADVGAALRSAGYDLSEDPHTKAAIDLAVSRSA
jgi:hypothetical protein